MILYYLLLEEALFFLMQPGNFAPSKLDSGVS